MPQPDEKRAVLEFLSQFLAEQAEGRARPLWEYLKLFPKHQDAVAREYLSLLADDAPVSPDESATDADGRRLGRYRILRELGRGGQAVVYVAEDERIGRKVALKILQGPLLTEGDGHLPARFQREAEAASRLDHPGLCQVFEAGVADGAAYIAMRLVPGRTLAQHLAGRTPQQPPSPEERALCVTVIEKAARALHAAHEAGVVHRDIKPGNIMLKDGGEPVILDFGIARDEASDLSLTRTGDLFGTPHSMSPEQLDGRGQVDARSDVWSLGVVLYECLTGRKPFDAATRDGVIQAILHRPPSDPRRLAPGLPRDLAVVLETTLAMDRRHRYQTAADLAEDLRRVRHHEPLLARPAGPAVRLLRWTRRKPALSTSLFALFLALAAGLSVSLNLWLRADRHLQEVRRLSDLEVLDEMRAEADRLWPAAPEIVAGPGGIDGWLARAQELRGRLPAHQGSLDRLRARGLQDATDRWWHSQLARLVEGLDEFGADLEEMRRRREFATSVDRRSLEEEVPRAAWRRASEAIASDPRYCGLHLRPQRGLIPLGPDPDNGLQEFAHLQTGAPALRDQSTGQLTMRPEYGMVFVLLPGGTFRMGAVTPTDASPSGPNIDPQAGKHERPVHEVTLSPFFLSKFEMTQAQWSRFMGVNPAGYTDESEFQEIEQDEIHPVELVSWYDCKELLRRLGLRFPTEAQWEYAARAGTTTVFWTGDAVGSLEGHTNLACQTYRQHGGKPSMPYVPWGDGYPVHAPVGSFSKNGFGLHDMLGNVAEWVWEAWESYDEVEPGAGDGLRWIGGRNHRMIRGSSFSRDSVDARSAFRGALPTDARALEVGLRPARAVDP